MPPSGPPDSNRQSSAPCADGIRLCTWNTRVGNGLPATRGDGRATTKRVRASHFIFYTMTPGDEDAHSRDGGNGTSAIPKNLVGTGATYEHHIIEDHVDIGMFLHDIPRDIAWILKVFTEFESISHLALHPKKCAAAPIWCRDHIAFKMKQWMQDPLSFNFVVSGAARYLGLMLGPEAGISSWSKANNNY